MKKQRTIAIDFDGTLCKKQTFGDGEIYENPNPGARDAVLEFLEEGYDLVIYSVRLNPKWGDAERQKKNIRKWLEHHEIPITRIEAEKPKAVAYIDDRGVRFTNWRDIQNYFVQ